jgi:hypothetical protein
MHLSRGTLGALAVLIATAVLEVAGYALIRKGMGTEMAWR